MGYSSSRLTLYAILSAIEEDLRALIQDHLDTDATVESILGSTIYQKSLERLNKDIGMDYPNPELGEILPYIDFADAFTLLNQNASSLPEQIARYVKGITPELESISPVRNRVAHGRPLNFDDLAKVLDFADKCLDSNEPLWPELKATRVRLQADPSFVLGLTIPNYEGEESQRRHNLPQPDFDETGFLGREQQVNEVIRLCVGPYPVITISGEGGIGKTALALKVSYDLLDLPNCPFEAIVWASSKTTTLTPHEIVRIRGAISDSLGVFQSVATELGAAKSEDPLTEVLEYLKEFKILLILDNLETVLDDRVRSFLQQMPSGSKILLTSRIGLGAFEFPYKLPAMKPAESVQLLRALGKIRGLNDLVHLPQKTLERFCNRMQNNPGWIKWFVSAVQAGRRPEEVIDKSDMFLEFCMSNVYGYLSAESKKVLGAMLSIPGTHSQAELAFLNEMDAVDLQKALQLLLTTNFAIMNSVPVGSSFESKYGISELGREFLNKHHPVSNTHHREFTKRKRQLVAAGEQIKIEQKTNPFSYQSIVTRSPSDLIVARYLLDALARSQRGDFAEANKALRTAKNLAPSYYEVHRAEAIVHMLEKNYPAAREAYERAIEYEPKSAPLRYWFGNFLVRYVDDLDEALVQLQEALKLTPDAAEIRMELARVYIYNTNFDEAAPYIHALINDIESLSQWNRRKLYDLVLSFYQRRADHRELHRNSAGALDDMLQLKRTFTAIPKSMLDMKMFEKLAKVITTASACKEHLVDQELKAQATEVLHWLFDTAGRHYRRDKTGSATFSDEFTEGRVAKLLESFGFIDSDSGGRLFFHRSELTNKFDWRRLRVGTKVRFRAGVDASGKPAAGSVSVVAESTTSAG